MPGSVTADVLARRPLELAIRATLGFACALWLSVRFGPPLLDGLRPFYEHALQLIDGHYRIDLALTHRTGHDTIGSDLVVLLQATVTRSFVVFGADTTVTLAPGEVLRSSTAIGILMQPVIVIVGTLLGWPLHGGREGAIRTVLGTAMLAFWLLFGITSSLWVFFRDIPIQAYAPNAVSWSTLADKFLLNGGGVLIGALLAAIALATGRAVSGGGRG